LGEQQKREEQRCGERPDVIRGEHVGQRHAQVLELSEDPHDDRDLEPDQDAHGGDLSEQQLLM
jgi:hypothetical protein